MGPRQILPSSSASDTLGARNTDISGSHNLTVSSNTTEQQKGDSVPNLARSQDLSLYSPTELANWDWGESVQLSDHFYEPQGVLVEELQNQQNPGQDFVIPHPVSANLSGDCSNEQQRQQRQSGNGASQHPVFATPAQKPLGPRASLKRKATSEPSGASATDLTPLSTSRSASQRQRAEAQAMTGDTDNPTQTAPRPPATRSRSTTSVSGSADAVNRPRQGGAATGGGSSRTLPGGHADPLASRSRRRTLPDAPDTPFILPPRKVFPIQIGSELFRLSGASISSDAPSYFSQFFEEQLRMGGEADSVRTLYIDRDPETFRDIALHLQGYHIEPRDGTHFVRLFADVQFYSLPRLTARLFSSTIYIRIGSTEFQIPRDLFNNPGDSPNFFSLGFAAFFSTPNEVFPGLNQRTLLRPPSILPPSVPGRSANIFADLLHVLKGYPLEIRNAEHRAELLRDARYFHLKGLEQKLIAHDISYNLARGRQEILLRLEDIRQSGISFTPDATPASSSDASSAPSPATANPAELLSATSATGVGPTVGGWIAYQRPFVDSSAYELVLEIGSESTSLDLVFNTSHTLAQGRASFHGQTKARISSLFQVIANKMNLPVTQPLGLMMLERAQGIPAAAQPPSPRNSGISEDRVRVRIGKDAEVVLDGVRWPKQQSEESEGDGEGNGRKRKRTGGNTTQEEEEEEWTVVTGQWRVRMQPVAGVGGKSGMEAVMYAVKLEAVSGERGRNARRGFLGQ